MSEIEAKGARVLAISVDGPEENKKLSEKLGLTIPLYEDRGRQTIEAWGVANPKQEIAIPATFVVDRDGTILFQYVGEKPSDRPLVESFLAALDK